MRGRSIKEISRELRVSGNTVRKILRSGETAFGKCGTEPDWGYAAGGIT